jgi:hypothetical protein
MNNLALHEETFSLAPRNLGEAMEFAKIIASSDMVPKDYINKPGNVLVAVQTGAEIGLKPMQSLQGISVINGRPGVWGDAMWALVISHPEYEDSTEDKSDTSCTITLKRRGRSAVVVTFNMEDAKKAGLAGKAGPWQTAPKRMLQLRARAFAARDLFADALKGIKSVEELRDYSPEPEKDMGAAVMVTSEARPAVATCSDEKFSANRDAWKKVVTSGRKTPAEMIAFLETKSALTEAQKAEIKGWTVKPEEDTASADPFTAALDSSGDYTPE